MDFEGIFWVVQKVHVHEMLGYCVHPLGIDSTYENSVFNLFWTFLTYLETDWVN